jgi:hypothetical protein
LNKAGTVLEYFNSYLNQIWLENWLYVSS